RRYGNEHFSRAAAFVLERVRRADRHVGEHPRRRHDPLAVDRERDLAFEDVKAFLLPAVDVRGRSAAWTHERFKDGVLTVRVLAGRQEAVHITNDSDGAAFAGFRDDGSCHVRLLLLLAAESRATRRPVPGLSACGDRRLLAANL